jgi:hypothetical protein
VKRAHHKNTVPTGFACIDDNGTDYIPDLSSYPDVPLNVLGRNVTANKIVPMSGTSSSLSSSTSFVPSSSLPPSYSSSSSLINSHPFRASGTQRPPRSSSAPTLRNKVPLLSSFKRKSKSYFGFLRGNHPESL